MAHFPQGGTLSNSQCTLYNIGTGLVSLSGTDLTLDIRIGLTGSFALTTTKVYLWIVDNAGTGTGWVQTSTWNLGTPQPPTLLSWSPTTTAAPQPVFTFTARDANGANDISRVYFVVNTTGATAQNGCHGFYDKPSNALYLYNDSLSTVTGPLVPGIAGTLQNSQCMLFGMGSSAAMVSSTDLAVSIEIDLLGSFAAASKNVYVWIVDNAGSGTGWIQTSTWNPVQSDPPPVSCSLRVDQLPGTPTVTRTSGNNIVGQGFLRLHTPAIGNWLVYLRAHLQFQPTASSPWTEVNYNETITNINSGTGTGFSYSSGPVQASLQPRGNGNYRTTISSRGICGGNVIPLNPENPAPSGIVSVARPTIVPKDGAQGIWWFGAVGKDDAANGYYSYVPITGTPNWTGTLTYAVTQNPVKVQLSCTNCNSPVAQAVAVSTSGCSQDVSVTASVDGFMAVSSVLLMVNRPAGRYSTEQYFNSPVPGGYWSKDYFIFTDLCSMGMPSVAHRESFPGGIKYYWPGSPGSVSSYWTSTPPEIGAWEGYTLPPWSTHDDIIVQCVDPAACLPQSVEPSSHIRGRSNIGSLFQQKIAAIQQMWWVGDSLTGGFLANQCNQTLYQDHAEDINFW